MARTGEVLYCEMCGSRIAGRPYRAVVDGVEMVLCASCYMKLAKSGRAVLLREPSKNPTRKRPAPVKRVSSKRVPLDQFDIVEDYYDRIRRAREAKGWTMAVLAQKLRISEAMLRKIESGKMKPSINLARKIENLLKIKILEPTEVSEEEDYKQEPGTLTLGDVVIVRKDED
ncbi:MAG: multiprotein bridging factor aMBF1 [Desulfurococcales archaeon]|nr:multiprotein bridging factor aMBF1 [Desulfurococcales archaeon]